MKLVPHFDFVQEYAPLTREAFLQRVQSPYLYFDNLTGLAETAGFTTIRRGDTPAILYRQEQGSWSTLLGLSAVAAVEHARDRVSGRITLGRGSHTDIQIPDRRISKVHVGFIRAGDLWMITDTRSTNGTEIDGVPLLPGQSMPLTSGARILLSGVLRAVFLEPADLYHLIQDTADMGPER